MLDWSLVLGNPFWLGSIPFAYIGWIIAFIGQCVDSGSGSGYSRAAEPWWIIMFDLFLITGVLFVIATDSIREYRIVVTAFVAISIVYTTDQAGIALSRTIGSAAAAAIAAGYIFVVIVMFTWVFAFGSSDDSFIFAQLNSYSVAVKPGQPALPTSNNGITDMQYPSQQGGIPMGTVGSGYTNSAQQPMGNFAMPNQQPVNSNTEYAFRAMALYAYEANQEDPNELSFAKGDTLDIVDNKGKWWQARKEDGTVGIAPSNYLKIT